MNRHVTRRVAGDRREPSRGDQQRSAILRALTEQLATVPLTDLSVLKIADHAGVTRTVFYFYFESKYAALAAALQEVWDEFAAAREPVEVLDGDTPPTDRIHRGIADAVAIWQRHGPLIRALLQGRESDPQLARMWQQLTEGTADSFTATLTTLRDQGRITPASPDLRALVDVLLGMTAWTLTEQAALDEAALGRRIEAMTVVWNVAVFGA